MPKKTETGTETGESKAPDPFDLESLRAPQNFIQTGGVKKTTLNIRASKKPPKDKFIRVHPFDPTHGREDWCFNVLMYEHTPENEISGENFIVIAGSDPYTHLLDKLRPALVVAGTTPVGNKFLWELTLPTPQGNRRSNQWHETRCACAKVAVNDWVRLEPDMDAGGYNYVTPLATLPNPDWGTDSFATMFEIAYRDRVIRAMDHPVVREFLGA